MFSFLSQCRLAVVLVAAATLPACKCESAGPPPPSFMLAFSTDTTSSTGLGFRRAELRSAYLVRYRDNTLQSLIDTLPQPSAATAKSGKAVFPIYYYTGYPPQVSLPQYVSQTETARSFRLVVPAANRTYDISNIVLEQQSGDTNCSIRTTRSEATVNGQLRDGVKTTPVITK